MTLHLLGAGRLRGATIPVTRELAHTVAKVFRLLETRVRLHTAANGRLKPALSSWVVQCKRDGGRFLRNGSASLIVSATRDRIASKP